MFKWVKQARYKNLMENNNFYHYITTIILIITFLIIYYNHFVYNPLVAEAVLKTELNEFEENMISILKESTNLLINLSIALMAMIGYYTLETLKKGEIDNSFKIVLLMAFCSIILSIDFGYTYLSKLADILQLNIFEPSDESLKKPHDYQILSFILALFLSIRYIFKRL